MEERGKERKREVKERIQPAFLLLTRSMKGDWKILLEIAAIQASMNSWPSAPKISETCQN